MVLLHAQQDMIQQMHTNILFVISWQKKTERMKSLEQIELIRFQRKIPLKMEYQVVKTSQQKTVTLQSLYVYQLLSLCFDSDPSV